MNLHPNFRSTLHCGIGLVAALWLSYGGSSSAIAGVSVLNPDLNQRIEDLIDRPAIQLVQSQGGRAREQALVGRLEEEIRRLNGRIEELEFEQRRTNDRLDGLIEEFQSLTVAPVPSLSSDQGNLAPEEALRDLAVAPAEGTLGSIPESAVANLSRPDPSDVAAPERSALTPEERYESAVQLLQAGNFKGAQSSLELFLEDHQNHQLASNAAYWLAESHYVRQNYSAAAAAFARNYRNYGKESPKAIDNLLKLGMSLSNLGEGDKACLSYDELASTFPNTPAHIQQAVNRERARAKCG